MALLAQERDQVPERYRPGQTENGGGEKQEVEGWLAHIESMPNITGTPINVCW
jgi:hypothetical protein